MYLSVYVVTCILSLVLNYWAVQLKGKYIINQILLSDYYSRINKVRERQIPGISATFYHISPHFTTFHHISPHQLSIHAVNPEEKLTIFIKVFYLPTDAQ
jgi:hypothetical protein